MTWAVRRWRSRRGRRRSEVAIGRASTISRGALRSCRRGGWSKARRATADGAAQRPGQQAIEEVEEEAHTQGWRDAGGALARLAAPLVQDEA